MELKSKRDRLQVGLLLLPGLLVFALFTIYPIVKLLYMSFLQWDLGSMLHQKFIGLQNYIDAAQPLHRVVPAPHSLPA